MNNLYRLLALYGVVWAFLSLSMCRKQDVSQNTGENPWDSILRQKMPLSDCKDEMRDSAIYLSERLMVLEEIARIQKRRQTYIQPDPAYQVIFRQKQ